tara:strand:+ start:46 stop:801 length:756 start_codon:yes stop_codon:yes gene_type:complete
METKKIIITGGATRIGRSIALKLADFDTQIVIHYSKSFSAAKKLKSELENLGSTVYLLKADLNILKQTQRIIPFSHKKMKGISCLINNASIFENDNLSNFSDKSFLKHLNVNLKAPAILTRDFAKLFNGNNGNIINIIDQRVEKLTPFFFSYTMSKAGLVTLTKTSAMKLAPRIRVNAVSPGPTLKNKRQSEKHFKKQWKSTILGKKVDTENISSAVKFLINNYNITGQIINVDSGQRLAWKTPDIINVKE